MLVDWFTPATSPDKDLSTNNQCFCGVMTKTHNPARDLPSKMSSTHVSSIHLIQPDTLRGGFHKISRISNECASPMRKDYSTSSTCSSKFRERATDLAIQRFNDGDGERQGLSRPRPALAYEILAVHHLQPSTTPGTRHLCPSGESR